MWSLKIPGSLEFFGGLAYLTGGMLLKSEISGDNLESALSSGGRRMLGGKWAVWGCG